MKPCCAKPFVRIIRVGDFEAGIMGLDDVFRKMWAAGVVNEDELGNNLLALVRNEGNYITPSREREYRLALLREYEIFKDTFERSVTHGPTNRGSG
jgi:hypothetical protein